MVRIEVIYIDPAVLVAVDNVVDDGVIAAAGQLDPGCIRLDHREVFIRSIVTDDIITTFDHTNANTGVVIHSIACDRGVGGTLRINTLRVWVGRESNASVTDVVVL